MVTAAHVLASKREVVPVFIGGVFPSLQLVKR
jgi:hypothetical protein